MPDSEPLTRLPLLVATPTVLAFALVVLRMSPAWSRRLTMATMLGLAAVAWSLVGVDTAAGPAFCSAPWIPSIGAELLLGLDGLSLPLVVLTASLCPLALAASGSITRQVRGYCVLLLLIETGMLGVFLALDFVLFYVCWELILVPMYFLIALWGGANRQTAALRFFVYTLAGSLLMLAGGLIAYGYSDLTQLSTTELAAAGVFASEPASHADRTAWLESDNALAARFSEAEAAGVPARTFNLLALVAGAQRHASLDAGGWLGKQVGWWVFVLLLVGMAIKLPAAPLHVWLPQAHVEAPTGVSMLLAGVMLKLGGYGLVRIAWPLCPAAASELAPIVAGLGAVSIVWGALAALAQDDLKRLVAYSSVSHMGYVLVGLAAGAVGAPSGGWNADAWRVGAAGAVFQMVAHGVTSAGLFYCVGVLYDRFGHRDLRRLGGLMNPMPLASGLGILLFMASLGVPGLCGFVGELLPLLGAWDAHPLAVGVAATGTALAAAYTVRALRMAYFGSMCRGEHADAIRPLRLGEVSVLAPLAVAAIVLGVRPQPVLSRVEPVLAATAAALSTTSPEVDVADTPRTTR